jgi:hypothetical protein
MGPSVNVGGVAIEPGRVVAHRLNRVEYDNTTRDLLFGLDLHPAAAFPIDNFAEGFDNNAQELGMSNLLMEKYLDAARPLQARRIRRRRQRCLRAKVPRNVFGARVPAPDRGRRFGALPNLDDDRPR